MRTVAAILAYLMAAMSGLAAGYYATAPRAAAAPLSTGIERHPPHTWRGSPADLEAAAAFLAAEQRRADALAEPASADL